jgi:hypothetical protein
MLRQVADVEPSSAGVLRLIYGHQASQAIHVSAALGIADLLAHGPRAVDELACRASARGVGSSPRARRAVVRLRRGGRRLSYR